VAKTFVKGGLLRTSKVMWPHVVVEMNSGQYKIAIQGFLGREVEGVTIFGDVSKEIILQKL